MVIAANMMLGMISDGMTNSSCGGFFTPSLGHAARHKKNA
jgi:hypothetical protein